MPRSRFHESFKMGFLLLGFCFLFVSSTLFNIYSVTASPTNDWGIEFQKGISTMGHSCYNGFSLPQNYEDIQEFKALGADTICIVTSWYVDDKDSTYIHNTTKTHDLAMLGDYIDELHENNTNVFFKPMIDLNNGDWRAHITPSPEWWESWDNFTLMMAEFAQNHTIEIFSIGCEMGSMHSNTSLWKSLITQIRGKYEGLITYSANWDAYNEVKFWDALDIIGVDAWYPLTKSFSPTMEELIQAWNGISIKLARFSEMYDMPIIFSEIGYQSRDGTNIMPWSMMLNVKQDWEEQAMCYRAFFESNCYCAPWLVGCYWWDYFPVEYEVGDPYYDEYRLGFHFNGKPAADVVDEYYHQDREILEDNSYFNEVFIFAALSITIIAVAYIEIYKRMKPGEKNARN